MKKKILIISAAFYPDQSPRSFRATELAKEFSRQGHNVTVYTYPGEGHENFCSHMGINIEYLSKKKIKDIGLLGNSITILYKRVIRRLLNLFFEYPNIQNYFTVRKKLKQTDEKFDLLISIAVPHPIHWGVSSVWEKSCSENIAKTWIADCGDPFMYGGHDTFNKMFYFHYYENGFLRKSDYVTVPIEELVELFNKKYRKKIRVIPQGFKIDNLNLPEYTPNEVPTFIYSGTVMPGFRDPFSLIDFLNHECYDYRFIIYTRQRRLFNKYDQLLNDKIFLKDYIPRKKLLLKLAKADFLVNINVDSVDGKLNASPSKLIDYSISGRPILSYEQSKLPVDVVKEFMRGDYRHAYKDFDLDKYRIESVTRQFLELLEKI